MRPSYKKHNGSGDKKYRYIEPIGRFAECAVKGVKYNGYRRRADNGGYKLYAPKAFVFAEIKGLYDSKNKQREKQ
jgi:hypothetical protein